MPEALLGARAETAVALARREAQCRGIPAVFTAHLLVAVVAMHDAAVEHVVAEVGLEAEQVFSGLGLWPVGEEALPRGPIPHLTEQCANVLEAATVEASLLGADTVEPEHLLLGMASVQAGWAGHVLTRMGVEVAQLRAATRSLQGIRLLRAAAETEPPAALLMRPAPCGEHAIATLLQPSEEGGAQAIETRKDQR
jgi:ATP-dependent Clp protease ATP-binding subunit ClpA